MSPKARKLVGPGESGGLADWIWPQMHARWWNRDVEKKREKSREELLEFLHPAEEEAATEGEAQALEQAKDTLAHVQEIAQTAVDRAAAADRRATTIAGTVAIAASFTLSGAGIVLDPSRITERGVRLTFAIVLCATTALFVASAIYALRALVATRGWDWIDPHDLPRDSGDSRVRRLEMRAVHLLDNFAGNWEISDLKNRLVDRALLFLLGALVGIAGLAGLLIAAVG